MRWDRDEKNGNVGEAIYITEDLDYNLLMLKQRRVREGAAKGVIKGGPFYLLIYLNFWSVRVGLPSTSM